MAPSFGDPVRGGIRPYGSPSDPPNFRVTRPFADGSVPEMGPHDGLDLGNGQSGDDVLAIEDGEVYSRYTDPNGALVLRIDHGDGWSSGYAHMDKFYVALGERVSRGQKIARLDNTGYSSGAHLHFDITKGSTRKDPWPLIASGKDDDMGPWPSGEYERIANDKYTTKDGARFRADTDTDAQIWETFPEGETVIPYGRAKGEKVDGSPWWYLTVKWADGKNRPGAFHESSLKDKRPDVVCEDCPDPEPCPDPCAEVVAASNATNRLALLVLLAALIAVVVLAGLVVLIATA